MKISRTKFVFLFIVFAFAFILSTDLLLGQAPESLFAQSSQARWQAVVSVILSPVKIVLMGPLLPFIKFLHQDPDTPPPFFLIGFAFYWTILGLVLYFLLHKINAFKLKKRSF